PSASLDNERLADPPFRKRVLKVVLLYNIGCFAMPLVERREIKLNCLIDHKQ
ncbi:hypothetical protein CpipJ_CPIJ006039, partial [Culex quinquefasciatus]